MSEIAAPTSGGTAVSTLAPSPVVVESVAATPAAVPRADPQPAVQPKRGFRGRLRRVGWYLARPLVLLRYLLRKSLWVLVRIIRAGWRHPIVSLLLIIAVGVGYQAYNEYVKEDPPPAPREVFNIAPAIPPPGIADGFLAAQRAYDGEAIWDMLPDVTQTNLLSQGVTKHIYAQRMLNLRANGVNFGDSVYVGGVEGADGINRYFYVTTLPLGNGQVTNIYQVLFIDRENGDFLGWDDPIPEELMSTMTQ